MTSGNLSEEPLAYRNDEALERLGSIADLFLMHDRDIETRCDDSVARVIAGRPVVLRRARGYVPRVDRRADARSHVAGAGVRRRCSRTRSASASATPRILGPHIGDLENLETYQSFERIDRADGTLPARHAGNHRPRPASRLPVDHVRAGAARSRQDRRAASPRARRERDGGARAEGPGHRRRVRRHRLRHRRHGVGRRGDGRALRRRSSAWRRCGRSRWPAAMRPSAIRGGLRWRCSRTPSTGGRRSTRSAACSRACRRRICGSSRQMIAARFRSPTGAWRRPVFRRHRLAGARPAGRRVTKGRSHRDEAPSITRCGLFCLVRGPVAGAKRSPHAPAPWGSDIDPRLEPAASRLRVGRLPERNDPRSRQPLEDWNPATRLVALHRIFWFGRDIFPSRPAERNRRRAQPPSRPAPFKAAAGLALTAASTMAA